MKAKMMMVIMMIVMMMAFGGCSEEEAYYEDEGQSVACEEGYEDEDDYDGYENEEACGGYDDDYDDDEACGDYDDCVPCNYTGGYDEQVDAASCSNNDYVDDYDDECYEDDYDDYDEDWDEDIEDYEDEVIEDYGDEESEEWVSIFSLSSAQGYVGDQIHTSSELNNDYDARGEFHQYHYSVMPNDCMGVGSQDIEFYNTDYDTLQLSFYPENRHDDCTSNYCCFQVIASDTGTVIYTSPEYRYGDYGNEVEIDISQYHNQRIMLSPKMPGSKTEVLFVLTDGIFVR